MNLYEKHRPKTLQGMVGQEAAVAALLKLIERDHIPHALLLTGPSGCGKTTIGRALKKVVECGSSDYVEINSADFKGIDMVRDLRNGVTRMPISGKTRIYFIDEAHKLTSDAQNAILKLLEDTPSHAYFMLATTDPQKLIKTIHTRCTEVKLSAVSMAALKKLIERVSGLEGFKVSEEVVEEIAEAADGSARKALVILEQVGELPTSEEQLRSIQTTTFNKEVAIDLARLLVTSRQPNWLDAAKILRVLKDEDAEGIRYCVLGYARACMVGSENRAPNMALAARAFKVVDIFSKNFYDSKHAGLTAACWEVLCTS